MHGNRQKFNRPFFPSEWKKPSKKISLLMHRIFFLPWVFFLCVCVCISINWSYSIDFAVIFPLFIFFLLILYLCYKYTYNIRRNFIQISIMLWYSFIFKHLHAEYILCEAWLVSPNTSITSHFFLFIYLFLGVKESEKESDSEWVWVSELASEEKEYESQQSLFSHILSWKRHAKRDAWHCPYVIIMFIISRSHPLCIKIYVYCIA